MSQGFIETYKALKKLKPQTRRDKVRHITLNFAAQISKGVSDWDLQLTKPRIQFIYLHHIFKDEEKQLDNLVRYLSKSHTFISFSQAIEKICSGVIDKPYIVFSSDDGLKNNLKAAEILSRYGATACFFICPGIVGVKDFKSVAAFCKERLHFPPVDFLSWDEISLLQAKGHEIGGHTVNHVSLAEIPYDLGSKEIFDSFEIITKNCGKPLHFAFPYGRYFHLPPKFKSTIYLAGYATCSSAERGCHITDGTRINKEELLIRRDHFVLNWPLEHMLYFMVKNIQKASTSNNYYPF